MKTLAAREAKNGFGHLLDMARLEPVTIERHGRPVAVMLSPERYAQLESLEEAEWWQQAEAGEATGYIGTAATATALKGFFDA